MRNVTVFFHRRLRMLLPILFLAVVFHNSLSFAAEYNVTTTADCITVGPEICLRKAIIDANDTTEEDLINLPEGYYELELEGVNEDSSYSGDLDILESLTIIGEGPGKTIIDANSIDRVFHIPYLAADVNVTLKDLTIQSGQTNASSPGPENGAGIFNFEKVILWNVVIQNNTVIGGLSSSIGGGVTNNGTIEIYDSVITGNSANRGGGVFNAGSSTLTMSRSLVHGNTALQGGGLALYGTFDLKNSTIHNNTATGSTAGGIIIDSSATGDIAFCTISDNWAPDPYAAGIRNSSSGLTLNASILSNNRTLTTSTLKNCDFSTAPTSAVYNIEDGNTCGFSPASNSINSDPLLGPLQNNGGETLTRALLRGSPAIDAVKLDMSNTEDQRGKSRPQGQFADSGAFEFGSPLCFPVKAVGGKVEIICM